MVSNVTCSKYTQLARNKRNERVDDAARRWSYLGMIPIVAGTLLVTKSRADAAKEKEENHLLGKGGIANLKGPGVGT